ncbi:hypothetical protein V491_02882 [Pseudogymnoascus sp. VKM F-3775]|nr:hypothetical protein V491_02882 [Pseudogymnoascus sp. VKM F-3775]
MDPITPVRTRGSISSSSLSKSEEEILKKLHSHPDRLSSGELAKTLLSTFNKNLGKFSFATTFKVYIRWLEAQRRAPQTTINYNWKNVITQWAQSLKARDFSLKDLVLEVEHWKRSNGPFHDPNTELNPRYPPTIDELETAYNMDLRPHSVINSSSAPPTKGDRHSYEEPRREHRGLEFSKEEAIKSPVKHYLSSPNNSSAQKSTPGGTIGLLVLNVANYTNHEVVEIFHPDTRCSVTRLEAWFTNRTVHFRTVEDRDRAYRLLPDDMKTRKEKDLTRPLVRIYSDRRNKARSDIDTSSGNAGSPEKRFRRLDDTKDSPEEIGLYFMNTWRYSRNDVERLFDERDILNIVGVVRLGKSDMVVRFPSIYLRDKALEHLPSHLKDDNETSRKNSLFVVLFNPKTHGRHPASRLRERQINGPDKFYSARIDKNENRIEKSVETTHGHTPRWRRAHDENDSIRLPDRTLSDDGRLSRYEPANNSSPEFRSRKRLSESPVVSRVQGNEESKDGYLNDEERMIWEQGQGDVFAGLWLEKLADEIIERRTVPNKSTRDHNYPVDNSYRGEDLVNKDELQYSASVANEISNAKNSKVGLKRSRTQDPVDDREYIGDCSKRTKREKDYSGHMDSFDGDLSDGDDIDCSTLVLTRVKRIDTLHIWDLLDDAKRQEDVVKNETSNSSEIDAMAEEIPDGNSNSQEISVDDSDGDKEVSGGDNNDGEEEAGAAIQKANNELGAISSPEDGWCSSRDYWAGSSKGSNSSGLEEDDSDELDPPGAGTVIMSDSDINPDSDMAYNSLQTPSG